VSRTAATIATRGFGRSALAAAMTAGGPAVTKTAATVATALPVIMVVVAATASAVRRFMLSLGVVSVTNVGISTPRTSVGLRFVPPALVAGGAWTTRARDARKRHEWVIHS
jgi:hypothetical protein